MSSLKSVLLSQIVIQVLYNKVENRNNSTWKDLEKSPACITVTCSAERFFCKFLVPISALNRWKRDLILILPPTDLYWIHEKGTIRPRESRPTRSGLLWQLSLWEGGGGFFTSDGYIKEVCVPLECLWFLGKERCCWTCWILHNTLAASPPAPRHSWMYLAKGSE